MDHILQTFSGIYANFNSFMPNVYKISLVCTLFYRLLRIISNSSTLDRENIKLRTVLLKNNYPSLFIDKCLKIFYDRRSNNNANVTENEKKKVTVILPYLGTLSNRIENNVKKVIKNALPNHSIRFVYKLTHRMSDLFKFKDTIPDSLQSNLVYLFTCSNCNITYVGMTLRHIWVRECEHAGISPRTGKHLKGTTPTAVRDHMLECDNIVSHNDFKILSKGGNERDIEIKESLMIKLLKPKLNNNMVSKQLSLFK